MNAKTQKLEDRVREPKTSALPTLEERQLPWTTQLWNRMKLSPTTPILVALVLVCIVLSILSERFFTAPNIMNILNQSAIVGIAAVGTTLVIITAGIDLSVGSNIALSGMVAATFVAAGGDGILGVIVALLVSTLIGAFNGASVAWLNLAPFIVTLATLGMGRGLTLQLSQGESIYDLPASFNWIGSATVVGVPFASVLTIAMFIVGHLILSNTVFGHKIYATGGNREAARLSGIKDRQTLFLVYAFAGLCAGISAVVLVGRLGSATPTAGTGLELQVIAAVVIGGTSLFGGKGSMFGTFIGVLLIGVINNGLTLLNVSPFWVQFVQAAMIFLAVLLDSFNTRRLARRKLRPQKSSTPGGKP